MLMESPHMTSYLMTIVMFDLSVTISNIFTIKILIRLELKANVLLLVMAVCSTVTFY